MGRAWAGREEPGSSLQPGATVQAVASSRGECLVGKGSEVRQRMDSGQGKVGSKRTRVPPNHGPGPRIVQPGSPSEFRHHCKRPQEEAVPAHAGHTGLAPRGRRAG